MNFYKIAFLIEKRIDSSVLNIDKKIAINLGETKTMRRSSIGINFYSICLASFPLSETKPRVTKKQPTRFD